MVVGSFVVLVEEVVKEFDFDEVGVEYVCFFDFLLWCCYWYEYGVVYVKMLVDIGKVLCMVVGWCVDEGLFSFVFVDCFMEKIKSVVDFVGLYWW